MSLAFLVTSLVIIVTPYLVRPVSASQIALPTDGYRHGNTAERVLEGQEHHGRSGEQRPVPTSTAPQTVTPGVDAVGSALPVGGPQQPPVQAAQSPAALPPRQTAANAQPGFNF